MLNFNEPVALITLKVGANFFFLFDISLLSEFQIRREKIDAILWTVRAGRRKRQAVLANR